MKPSFEDQCARKNNGFVSKGTEMRLKVPCDLFKFEVARRLSTRASASTQAILGTKDNNIEIITHADCCASKKIDISPSCFRSSRVFLGTACPSGLACMGVARELRPGNLSTSAVEQPRWALV